jgi:hypothetical protein
LAIGAVVSFATAARAQQTTTTTTTSTSAPTTTTSGYVQREGGGRSDASSALLGTGIVVFGLSYGTSVVVAATSDHDGDHHLYVPVAGPWIDMGNRGNCPVGSSACDNETTNKILLGIDGVLQAVGAIEIIGALLSPDQDTTVARAEPPKPVVHVMPGRIGTGYGMGAFVSF